jgi:antitoxin ParD1/3/4
MSLGKHYAAYVAKKLASGQFASVSEVVRAALRLLEERDEVREMRLRKLDEQIRAGEESGPGLPGPEVAVNAKARIVARAKSGRSRS